MRRLTARSESAWVSARKMGLTTRQVERSTTCPCSADTSSCMDQFRFSASKQEGELAASESPLAPASTDPFGEIVDAVTTSIPAES